MNNSWIIIYHMTQICIESNPIYYSKRLKIMKHRKLILIWIYIHNININLFINLFNFLEDMKIRDKIYLLES